MADIYFSRGSSITFDVQFLDKDWLPMAPSSATLYVAYEADGERQVAQIPLVSTQEGLFSASWDSDPADPGVIYWHVRAAGPVKAADEGSFILLANDANPDIP